EENNNLTVCDLPNLCTYLSSDKPRAISWNGMGNTFGGGWTYTGNCYNVQVLTVACNPVCQNPTSLSATNITTDSAKLNWSASGTYYDIEWGVQGFTPGEGTMVTNLEATTHTLTSLDYYTQYEFYVLSKCPNIELESEWVGPFTFMTLPLPCATPTDLSIDNITVDSASISWMSDGELFDIQWGTSGFQLGYGTVVSGIQTTTYDLTSLNGYTQYQVYVRKDCSVNQSDWV